MKRKSKNQDRYAWQRLLRQDRHIIETTPIHYPDEPKRMFDAINRKVCKECGEEKHINDFYGHRFTKDKKYSKCKLCMISSNMNTRNKLKSVGFKTTYDHFTQSRLWANRTFVSNDGGYTLYMDTMKQQKA